MTNEIETINLCSCGHAEEIHTGRTGACSPRGAGSCGCKRFELDGPVEISAACFGAAIIDRMPADLRRRLDEAEFLRLARADGVAPDLAAKVAIFCAAIAPHVREANGIS